MEKRFLTPMEIANTIVNVNEKRGDLKSKTCFLLGIMAGIFIGLGGLGNIIVTQTLGNIDLGLSRLAGAAVFPVGLMLVVIAGGELFTGNSLMTLAVAKNKTTKLKLLKNWSLVYIANFATKAVSIAQSKASIPIRQLFIRGILCNIVVTLAVWMATGAQDIISKIFACWFPIMLFVLCGFEHSIANMFFIPMGMMLGANISILELIINLIFVTLGNLLGGAFFVPFIYYNAYLKK